MLVEKIKERLPTTTKSTLSGIRPTQTKFVESSHPQTKILVPPLAK